jgi:hypothetical protein
MILGAKLLILEVVLSHRWGARLGQQGLKGLTIEVVPR